MNWHTPRCGGCALPYTTKVIERRPVHPLQTMSFADREMFAHNSAYQKQQAELKRILAQPEQRLKYAFQFLTGYIADNDEGMTKKCYDAISKYSDVLDTSEAHY